MLAMARSRHHGTNRWTRPRMESAVTTLPHTFKRIRLNLARSKEFPQGSSRHGYEFVAPLDANGPYRRDALARQSRALPRAPVLGRRGRRGRLRGAQAGRPRARRAGCSTTTRPPSTTTKAATASAPTPSARANTSRSATRTARRTPIRSSRWNRATLNGCGRPYAVGISGGRRDNVAAMRALTVIAWHARIPSAR